VCLAHDWCTSSHGCTEHQENDADSQPVKMLFTQRCVRAWLRECSGFLLICLCMWPTRCFAHLTVVLQPGEGVDASGALSASKFAYGRVGGYYMHFSMYSRMVVCLLFFLLAKKPDFKLKHGGDPIASLGLRKSS
jgi:hypothetical protein